MKIENAFLPYIKKNILRNNECEYEKFININNEFESQYLINDECKSSINWGHRALKNKKKSISQIDSIIVIISNKLISGDVSQGEALKKLRVNVLSMTQTEFSKLVGVSNKTISDIENNKGNYSVNTLNNVFKPFGLRLSLMPISFDMLSK